MGSTRLHAATPAEEVRTWQSLAQTCSQSLFVVSDLSVYLTAVQTLTSVEFLVFLAEELICASGKRGQAPLDHHGMVNESHSDGNVLWLEIGLILFVSVIPPTGGLREQLAVADDAVLRRRID
ncbi:hypothetical protein G6O67_005894 [Ophiocordyceps sinensis]|uniref:Uncharacterized protein n=1 Tax=Ophiocordyceps sinensis TaxID=72228 RepID=A0A8H4PLX6_9HYPO|nr:hypothetical protein G6O67_005894 [Ophiocordyceps sinensis]